MIEQTPRFIKIYDFFSGNLFPGENYMLVIPNYQRGYKWAVKDVNIDDATSSVEYLVKTILDSFETNNELFLQGITVSDSVVNSDGQRDVIIIDGQQRITTLYLLLWYLDPSLISNTNLRYDAREDTDLCLKNLKSDNLITLESTPVDVAKQDIFFIREGIKQIAEIFKTFDTEKRTDLISYLKAKIKVIYIPIIRKEDAVGTFTMMNGSKAIMRAEELIKSEFLRMVSQVYRDFSFEAGSMEEVLVKLRDFSAMDWNTAESRSRYAREWDKWLYWWNRKEVKTFFRTTNDSRPLGLLLDYYYRNADDKNQTYSNFRQFQAKHLKANEAVRTIFKKLRQLQKQFEDVFNDYYTHNMLAMALSCADRYETIIFFLQHLNESERNTIFKRFTEATIVGLSVKIAKLYALRETDEAADKSIKEYKNNFKDRLLAEFVYGSSDEDAFRYLSYRNILETNKLKERFNAGIFTQRSLEHIHPKSNVYHIDEATHKLMRGDGKPVSPESFDFPEKMPDGVIKRTDIRDVANSITLSEHSICNLVLLYGSNNSEFGNKQFAEKKNLFFQVTDQKRIIISRTLQHTLSKFAKSEWGVKDMIEYYNETKSFLENDFMA